MRDATGHVDAVHPSSSGLEKYVRAMENELQRPGCLTVLLADGWNLVEAATKGRSVLSYARELTYLLSASSVGQLVDVLRYLRDLGSRGLSTDVNLPVRGIPSDGASASVVLRPCAGLRQLYRNVVRV